MVKNSQKKDQPVDLLQVYQKAKYLYTKQSGKPRQGVSSSDQKWFQKLLSEGTTADRISALTIKIKDDPLFCLEPLEQILELATNMKQRQEALKSLFNIKDIFIHLLLKKPVQTFQANLSRTPRPTDEDLISFYLSHNIKRVMGDFIKVIEEKQNDPLVHVRRQSIIILVELYGTNSDATAQLLPTLVNKFGDGDTRLVVNLTKMLTIQLNKTPQLTLKVLKELENFMYRPNLKTEAQFYGLNFINQLNLVRQDPLTLQFIMKMFFTLFTKLIDLDDQATECSKILSQILRGINKTLPYTKNNSQKVQDIYNTNENNLYNLLRKTTNFKIKIQTLYFIFQAFNESLSLTDRFYRALYELMLNPEIEKTKLQELFFDLLFLSMKQDSSLPRQKAYLKRLLQIALQATPAFAITCLVFTSKILDQVKGLQSMIQQSENFFQDDEEEHFVDVDEPDMIPQKEEKKEDTNYDPFKRDPKYCRAETTSLWELYAFQRSFHPKVREYAQIVLQNVQVLAPKVNPLHEYDLSTFLTNFTEKTSRKTKRLSTQLTIVQGDELNDEDINESNIHMFKYLKQKFKQTNEKETVIGNKKSKKSDLDEQEEDDYADQLFEKELVKGDDKDQDEVDFDEDDDDDDMDEEDDGDDFPFGDDEDEDDNPIQKSKNKAQQVKAQQGKTHQGKAQKSRGSVQKGKTNGKQSKKIKKSPKNKKLRRK